MAGIPLPSLHPEPDPVAKLAFCICLSGLGAHRRSINTKTLRFKLSECVDYWHSAAPIKFGGVWRPTKGGAGVFTMPAFLNTK